MKKQSVQTFIAAKQKGEKLTLLTAYDYATAKIFDEGGIDGILVGDSLGMVVLGYENTLRVTLAAMLHHTKAVSRGLKKALLIADLPFMSYQTAVYDAVKNAGKLVQEGGAESVKLEGAYVEQIRAIVKAQIPVMGHLGLTPQSVHVLGGYRVQGKTESEAQQLIDDAKRLEDAGVFSIVLEGIPAALAAAITESVSIPTIGIGAGPGCDGQILVYLDMFNILSDPKPKFAKTFADVGRSMREGVQKYKEAVKRGKFPDDAHSY
ncbi:MAG: 3-methyl-2-oxobutanoate hydroxymethyltransferase [Flavobacteriales bacterium]